MQEEIINATELSFVHLSFLYGYPQHLPLFPFGTQFPGLVL